MMGLIIGPGELIQRVETIYTPDYAQGIRFLQRGTQEPQIRGGPDGRPERVGFQDDDKEI